MHVCSGTPFRSQIHNSQHLGCRSEMFEDLRQQRLVNLHAEDRFLSPFKNDRPALGDSGRSYFRAYASSSYQGPGAGLVRSSVESAADCYSGEIGLDEGAGYKQGGRGGQTEGRARGDES
jgi:hypothetical protein